MLILVGCAVALYVSAQRKNSLPMVFCHTVLGWLYVAYVGWRINFYDTYKQFKKENKD